MSSSAMRRSTELEPGPELQARWWDSHAAEQPLDATALRELTRDYWRLSGSMTTRVEWYIDHLLPQELACAAKRGALAGHRCDTLALLVGHSPEPLLQTISVFEPSRVLLLVNRWYSTPERAQEQEGLRRGGELHDLISDHLAPLLSQRPDVAVVEVIDRPDAVFQALCDAVLADHQAGRRVIVDITGAKKSMDAGAFLFAAYADIPISYVDFDDYDEANRRPFGFACRIGTLVNPYDAFRLRQWEQVRRLYTDYHFRAAVHTLEEILDVMRRSPVQLTSDRSTLLTPRPEHIQAADTLLTVLRFYEAWDDGDYRRARQLLPGISRAMPAFVPPAAVVHLGEIWPHAGAAATAESGAQQLLTLHAGLREPGRSLFRSDELLVTYAHDELAKIERLVQANEDNRSAVLRAAGLDELLLKARLVRLWHAGQLGVWDREESFIGQCLALDDAALRQKLYVELVNHHGTEHMRSALQGIPVEDRRLGKTMPAFVRIDVWRESYRLRPLPGVSRLADYEDRASLSGETLTHLRNQAIHMYLYVTQPIAQAACGLAGANLDDFVGQWLEPSAPPVVARDSDVKRLAWEQLCEMCGLDFLPLARHRLTDNVPLAQRNER